MATVDSPKSSLSAARPPQTHYTRRSLGGSRPSAQSTYLHGHGRVGETRQQQAQKTVSGPPSKIAAGRRDSSGRGRTAKIMKSFEKHLSDTEDGSRRRGPCPPTWPPRRGGTPIFEHNEQATTSSERAIACTHCGRFGVPTKRKQHSGGICFLLRRKKCARDAPQSDP